ncbi:hypothetical protein DFH06DRAFT_1442097 [Mycena polygramma]|nr:hypothetical protein DFH06DRAFT_1442097 [Mycena polygramma]
MHLPLLGWLCIGLFLLIKMVSPPPTPSSSLAHRRVTGVRNARVRAMSPMYQGQRSPRAFGQVLQDIRNVLPNSAAPSASSSLEDERLALRNADRDRQLALQETPSRRRRRVPDENRAGSPTPGPSGRRVQQRVGLQTPPATRTEETAVQRGTARSVAQRARRQQEADARGANPPPNRTRSEGQGKSPSKSSAKCESATKFCTI